MRKYEQIWIKLKRTGKATITAHPLLHARIIKAVVKEKYNDSGYKLQISPHYGVLSHTVEDTRITFQLKKFIGQVGVSDI